MQSAQKPCRRAPDGQRACTSRQDAVRPHTPPRPSSSRSTPFSLSRRTVIPGRVRRSGARSQVRRRKALVLAIDPERAAFSSLHCRTDTHARVRSTFARLVNALITWSPGQEVPFYRQLANLAVELGSHARAPPTLAPSAKRLADVVHDQLLPALNPVRVHAVLPPVPELSIPPRSLQGHFALNVASNFLRVFVMRPLHPL